MTEKQEFWDIYNEKKERTGRTMKRNDWCLKDGEYHLTVLDKKNGWTFPDHQTCYDKSVGTGLLGGFRRCCDGGRGF